MIAQSEGFKVKIQLLNPETLKFVLDKERTNKAGKEIYERTTGKFAFLVDTDRFEIDRHGFTDLGSIPKVLQVIPYLEHWRYLCSYGTHDSGYENKGFWINGEFRNLPREYIDQILKEMVIVEGVYQSKPIPAQIVSPVIYSGVRMGGWYNWNFRRKHK